MKHFSLYIGVALFIVMTFSNQVSAFSNTPEKPQTASVSFGAEFASGSYGTDSTIRSVYMPLIVSWSPNDRFDVGIEVPFIYQNSSNVTTDVYRNRVSSTTAKRTARGGPGGNSGIYQLQQAGGVFTTQGSLSGNPYSNYSGLPDSDASGLGDIILRAGYILFLDNTSMPQVRTSLFVKTPTASVSDGLGTGEFDFGGGFDLSKWFGDLHLAGEVLYNYQGRVSGFGLNNYVSYSGTVGYQLTKNLQPMLLLKGATAPTTYSDDLLEARARVIWSLTDKTSLDMYGSRGIADSSPDYGGGISVIYSF
ncbi:MAG: transporter [Desulfuromonadaceae bacterium]|nr:transporter [Desulfuromonadaceae bacterium]